MAVCSDNIEFSSPVADDNDDLLPTEQQQQPSGRKACPAQIKFSNGINKKRRVRRGPRRRTRRKQQAPLDLTTEEALMTADATELAGAGIRQPTSDAQRSQANVRERARMQILSSAFFRLKTALPWVPPDTKLSKLDTLRLASGYINYLANILQEGDKQQLSGHSNSDPGDDNEHQHHHGDSKNVSNTKSKILKPQKSRSAFECFTAPRRAGTKFYSDERRLRHFFNNVSTCFAWPHSAMPSRIDTLSPATATAASYQARSLTETFSKNLSA